MYRYTVPVNAVFFSYDYDFKRWSIFRDQCESPTGLSILVAQGEAIERKHQKDIRELLAKVKYYGFIDLTRVPIANLPYTLASDAGNLLAQDEPFAAVYYFDGDYYNFSLRSTEGGRDVSEVAKKFGGGGHKRSAGFRVRSLEDVV